MAGYGYPYQSYSTYNTAGSNTDESLGPAIRPPFVPFIPNSNRDSEGYVTRKTVVPVASRPYGDEYRPTKAYPIRDDDEWQRQTSPVHGGPQKVDEFLTKVQNEASRPARFIPVAKTDWRQSPQTGYNGANGYGDHGNYSNKEGYRPISSSVRNDNYYGNGYGDYGNYSDKEGQKPIGSSIRNDNYDRYQPAENYSSMEPNRTSPNGWSRPNISSGWTAPPRNGTQQSDYSQSSGGGYGDYSNKGWQKDAGNAFPNDGYYNYERRNEGVDRPTWAAPPGNGSQLREPSKIDKAMELVKEAERLNSLVTAASSGNGSQHKEPKTKIGKALELVKEAGKVKKFVTAPPQSRRTVPIEPRTSNKNDYLDNWEAVKKYNGTRV